MHSRAAHVIPRVLVYHAVNGCEKCCKNMEGSETVAPPDYHWITRPGEDPDTGVLSTRTILIGRTVPDRVTPFSL